MTSLIQNLITSITAHPKVDSNEPKQYELYVCNELLTLKQVYIEQFNRHLQQWLQTIHRSIITAINTKRVNQIRPKLELIYTSAINQQEKVSAEIEKIGDLLWKQVYCFEQEWEAVQKEQQNFEKNKIVKYGQTTDGFTQISLKPQTKSRSQSIGGVRRKLSKTSCFAQAKKIDSFKAMQSSGQCFNRVGSSKIKKSKKRDQTDFDYLQKCLSSTSPSNFMLNYMAVNINNDENKSNLYASMSKLDKTNSQHISQNQRSEALNNQKPKIIVSQPQQEYRMFNKKDTNQICREITGSDHYEKVMATFQQKITEKIDHLMDKYTNIEQKLQKSTSLQRTTTPQPELALKPPQTQLHTDQIPKQDFSPSTKQKITYVQCSPMKRQPKQDKQKKKQQTSARGSAARQITKAVHLKNKIHRNRTEESVPSEQSLEVIQLQNKKQEFISKKTSKEETDYFGNTWSGKESCSASIQQDKKKLQRMLQNYYQITLKVLLPISRKLLFVLKDKYVLFCRQNNLLPQQSILTIETEPVKDQKVEMRDNLLKMEKILSLNCTPQKKEKLVLYVNSFLDCFLTLSSQSSSKDLQMHQNVESKISQALKLLSL